MGFLDDFWLDARVAAASLGDFFASTGLRLGVTGLSRAGKTVFITALVDNLMRANMAARSGERILPVFRVHAEGRLRGARLAHQPDDNVARFAVEEHLAALTGPDRRWPQSTRRVSQLRVTIEFERGPGWRSGPSEFNLDIIDYPGEWLLDLPLLTKSFEEWSQETFDAAAAPAREKLSHDFRQAVSAVDPAGPQDEKTASKLAQIFKDYLKAARKDDYALSMLPPGRFLMPGDLEGSPALTFVPLPPSHNSASKTFYAMMARRYESYKSHVAKPFFRDHFMRLDRQIVLVDALSALNSGPAALRDLQDSLTSVLAAFRTGRSNFLTTMFRPRIDKILFAATKADHLHHTSHDRLEAIVRQMTARAIRRAEDFGARIDVVALAAVRATREARIKPPGILSPQPLDAIIGAPLAGERIDEEIFDGEAEAAIFPGELPADPKLAFQGEGVATPVEGADYRFVRFRPPRVRLGADGDPLPAPAIRLDRALEFLLGDRLQ